MNDKNSENPQDIPEKTEEVLKQYDAQLFVLSVLVARILLRLEKVDGLSPADFLQELEDFQKAGTWLTGSGGQDHWRFRRFDIAFSHTLQRLRGMLDDLSRLD